MSVTLFDLTYEIMREQGLVREGTATGGSATTIVDTVERTEADDYWNGGTAWILYDAGGAGASPQGKFSKITDFAASTDTVTIQTVTDAVEAGDRYAVARNIVPLEILIQKVNQALTMLGDVPLYNTTGITIAANQTEYSLPAAVRDLRRVMYQTVDDANDNRWVEMRGWTIQPNNTAGGADVLIFPFQLSTSYDVKLDYMGPHPALYTASSILYDAVPKELIIYQAVADCFRFRKQRSDWQRTFESDLRYYEEMAERMRQSRGMRNVIRRPGKLVDTNSNYHIETEVDRVVLE